MRRLTNGSDILPEHNIHFATVKSKAGSEANISAFRGERFKAVMSHINFNAVNLSKSSSDW